MKGDQLARVCMATETGMTTGSAIAEIPKLFDCLLFLRERETLFS